MDSLQDKITEKLVNNALQSLPKGSETLNQSSNQAIERIDDQLMKSTISRVKTTFFSIRLDYDVGVNNIAAQAV